LDFAEESTQLAKMQVLQQTGASMLTQANQISQIAIQLVQG
jgi:flagellin